MTYSNVNRSPGFSVFSKTLQALSNSSSGQRLLIGISSLRSSSVGAASEIARCGRSAVVREIENCAARLRRLRSSRDSARCRRPLRIGHDAQCFQQLVEVQKRFARAHADEICAARRLHANAVSIVERDQICSTISPGVNERSRPSWAVRQKVHCSGQPDCEEKQIVSRRSSGMKTVSTGRPS